MKKGGFTLVELIAVIIILGILAAIGIPQYRRAMERARGAEAYAGLGQLVQAEKILYTTDQLYYQTAANKMVANDMTTLDVSLPQRDWDFVVNSNNLNIDFTATATRTKGPCADKTITVDQLGAMNDDWKDTCVDNL